MKKILAVFVLGFLLVAPCFVESQIFYGMTEGGGSLNDGAIISFNATTNAEDTVHSFGRGEDGVGPNEDLVYDAANKLFYGMTENGGRLFNGAIISLNPLTNIEDTVHSFGGGKDGIIPIGSLIYDSSSGLYYGMAYEGGKFDTGGVIFSFNPVSNVEDTVHSFGYGTDAEHPFGNNLIYDAVDGLFYGMTNGGGTARHGAIFSFNPTTHTESVVHSFGAYYKDGIYPFGSLVYNSGNGLFYGMTEYGGGAGSGAIISFDPMTNTEDTVHCFGRGMDGKYPVRDLVYDANNGLFYGMTSNGGSLNKGAIISFNPVTNVEDTVHSFGRGIDGSNPNGNLVYDPINGPFYGMTRQGGSTGTAGAIISFNPTTNTEITVYSFRVGVSDGVGPVGDLVLYPPSLGTDKIKGESEKITVYPNPSNGEFTVSIRNEELGIKNIEVYNVLGEKVYLQIVHSSSFIVDLSNHPNGVYLYRVISETGNLIGEGKLVIQSR